MLGKAEFIILFGTASLMRSNGRVHAAFALFWVGISYFLSSPERVGDETLDAMMRTWTMSTKGMVLAEVFGTAVLGAMFLLGRRKFGSSVDLENVKCHQVGGSCGFERQPLINILLRLCLFRKAFDFWIREGASRQVWCQLVNRWEVGHLYNRITCTLVTWNNI